MQLSAVEQKYFDYLDKIAISTLRAIGREVGVSSASTQNKDLIIRNITDICTGKLKPAKPSGRGAPVKDKIVPSEYLDGLKKIQAETAGRIAFRRARRSCRGTSRARLAAIQRYFGSDGERIRIRAHE